MKRVIGLVVLSALALTGCAGSTPDDAKDTSADGETLVIAVRNGDNAVVPALAEAWNEAHPDKPVTVELLDGNADQQRQQFSLELNAGSDEFDVIGLDVTWTGEFARNGWIADLGALRDRVSGKVFEGPLASAVYDDALYAVPLLVGVGLLYHRTDLVPEPADTWEGLVAQGTQAASDAGIAPFAAQGASYEGMVVNYLEYLWSAGGDLYDDDFSRATLTDGDAALKALQFMKDSYENGFYAPGFNTMTEAEARPAFEGGEVALMRHWVAPYLPMSTSADSAVAGLFDVRPLPRFEGGESVAALGGLNLAVNAHSDSTERAIEFIEWATTDEAAGSVLIATGVGPAARAAYDSAEAEGSRFYEVLAEILPHARPRPPLPTWEAVSSTMQREIFAAYTGQKDPQQALDAIQTVLEESLQK